MAIFLLVACMFAIFADISEASPRRDRRHLINKRGCDGFDSACYGDNGSQGSCCGGMHCQKNDPSWAQGRCYYNPGK